MFKRGIRSSLFGEPKKKKVKEIDECSKGGKHNLEPNWEWDTKIDDYNFIDLICTKCGETDGGMF